MDSIGAPLDSAWGQKTAKETGKRRKTKDPVCDMYASSLARIQNSLLDLDMEEPNYDMGTSRVDQNHRQVTNDREESDHIEPMADISSAPPPTTIKERIFIEKNRVAPFRIVLVELLLFMIVGLALIIILDLTYRLGIARGARSMMS